MRIPNVYEKPENPKVCYNLNNCGWRRGAGREIVKTCFVVGLFIANGKEGIVFQKREIFFPLPSTFHFKSFFFRLERKTNYHNVK